MEQPKQQLVDRTNSPLPSAALAIRPRPSTASTSTAAAAANTTNNNNNNNNNNTVTYKQDATLTVVRTLTKPLLEAPSPTSQQLGHILTEPWNLKVRLAANDYTMRQKWKGQTITPLFTSMMEWENDNTTSKNTSTPSHLPRATLSPYFGLSENSNTAKSLYACLAGSLFTPWVEIGKRLQKLLLHQVACRQHGDYLVLSSHQVDLFLATGPEFDSDAKDQNYTANNLFQVIHPPAWDRVPDYYLLRCRYHPMARQIQFGYHHYGTHSSGTQPTNATQAAQAFREFHSLVNVSLQDENWRLMVCIILKNLARIVHCLKDYTVPLQWSPHTKLQLVEETKPPILVQKLYDSEYICPEIKATVANMIRIYQTMQAAGVPHTDRLVSVTHKYDHNDPSRRVTICQFAPIGRAFLPLEWNELLDALICVAETLVALHAIDIAHRDIRWSNVFHALDNTTNTETLSYTREWVLFDFEFAAVGPQSALGVGSLTPGNHAPEMVDTASWTAVDIWGLGYLLEHAYVDIPDEFADDVRDFKEQCLHVDPCRRPSASACLEVLQSFRHRPSCKRRKT